MGVYYQTGNYWGECTDLAFSEDANGKPKIQVRVRIESQWDASIGDWVGVPNSYERTAYLNIPDEEEYKKFIVLKLRNAGWTGSSFDSVRDELVGKRFAVKNEVKKATKGKYEGQEVENWDLPLPVRESTPLENKPAVAKKLNALFGKTLKEVAAPPAPAKPEPVAAAAQEFAPDNGQDVPF